MLLLLATVALTSFLPEAKSNNLPKANVPEVKTVKPTPSPKLRVIVTKRAIKQGEQLTATMLAARDVEEHLAPSRYVTLENASSLLNKVTNKPIKSRAVITPEDVNDLPPSSQAKQEVTKRALTLEINPNAIDEECRGDISNKRFDIYWRIKTNTEIVSLLLAHSVQITSPTTSECDVPASVLANAEVFEPPPCVGLSLSVDESAADILTVTQKQNFVGRYPSFKMSCHPVSDDRKWEDAKTLTRNEVRKWIGDIPFFRK